MESKNERWRREEKEEEEEEEEVEGKKISQISSPFRLAILKDIISFPADNHNFFPLFSSFHYLSPSVAMYLTSRR